MKMELFKYNGTTIRTIVEDDEPWFVASDVAKILGYRSGPEMTRILDVDEKGTQILDTPGGKQELTVITEPALYHVIMARQAKYVRDLDMQDQIKKFQRWVTHEVLPTIRKTGSYGGTPELTGPELMAKALLEAQSTLEAKDAKIAELTPKADVFDQLLTADGSYLVGDAAKILCNAGIQTGQKRLFAKLDELGWTSKPFGRPRRAIQRAVEQKLIVVKPMTYWDQKRDERVIGDPQIRLTTKGIYKLRDVMLYPLELTA